MSIAAIKHLLEKQSFLIVATADTGGQPNAAPMFFIHADDKYLYLVDYTMGQTYRNIKANPRVSISVSDMETLSGFKMTGAVKILTQGPVYAKIYSRFEQKTVDLSVKRVIKGIRESKSHKHFEAGIPSAVVIYQINVKELTEINAQGKIERKYSSS